MTEIPQNPLPTTNPSEAQPPGSPSQPNPPPVTNAQKPISSPSHPHSKKFSHNKPLIIAILIFLSLGIAYFFFWLLWGRFHEYTNDAYVGGNKVVVTPQIEGIVTSLTALSTDYVPKGRVLVEIDQTDALIALERSIAELGKAVREVQQMFENAKVLQASILMKKAVFLKSALDYERRKALIDEGAISKEDLEHSEADLQSAFADLIATEHNYIAALSLVENTSIDTHPFVEEAKNAVRSAYVFLQRCIITSPVSGIVAQRTVQVGERVKKAQPLMAIVPLDQMWVDANFKEVQLKKMRVGQEAKVTSDIYGGQIAYHGKVVGIGGGTGSVFSVLPPQNATGNWIKIVQRLPVKIEIDAEELKSYPLRLGLSMEVTVDIENTNLPAVPDAKPDEPIYSTDVFEEQESGAEELISIVIQENLSPHFINDTQEVY